MPRRTVRSRRWPFGTHRDRPARRHKATIQPCALGTSCLKIMENARFLRASSVWCCGSSMPCATTLWRRHRHLTHLPPMLSCIITYAHPLCVRMLPRTHRSSRTSWLIHRLQRSSASKASRPVRYRPLSRQAPTLAALDASTKTHGLHRCVSVLPSVYHLSATIRGRWSLLTCLTTPILIRHSMSRTWIQSMLASKYICSTRWTAMIGHL